MQTEGGWINISHAARLYGKDRKWVYDQIEQFGLSSKKVGNRRMVQLTDLIAHRGEPQNGAPDPSETHSEQSQKITPDPTPDTELLKQENQFLHQRIDELKADQAERQARETQWDSERSRLQGIIERQTYALPKPQSEGMFSRFIHWVQSL